MYKRILALLVISLITLTGCGSSDEEDTPTAMTQEEKESASSSKEKAEQKSVSSAEKAEEAEKAEQAEKAEESSVQKSFETSNYVLSKNTPEGLTAEYYTITNQAPCFAGKYTNTSSETIKLNVYISTFDSPGYSISYGVSECGVLNPGESVMVPFYEMYEFSYFTDVYEVSAPTEDELNMHNSLSVNGYLNSDGSVGASITGDEDSFFRIYVFYKDDAGNYLGWDETGYGGMTGGETYGMWEVPEYQFADYEISTVSPTMYG